MIANGIGLIARQRWGWLLTFVWAGLALLLCCAGLVPDLGMKLPHIYIAKYYADPDGPIMLYASYSCCSAFTPIAYGGLLVGMMLRKPVRDYMAGRIPPNDSEGDDDDGDQNR
jgi:hypothetical protein